MFFLILDHMRFTLVPVSSLAKVSLKVKGYLITTCNSETWWITIIFAASGALPLLG